VVSLSSPPKYLELTMKGSKYLCLVEFAHQEIERVYKRKWYVNAGLYL
jgi:hypothetical protein